MSLNSLSEVKAIIEVPTNLEDASISAFQVFASLIVTEDLSGKGLSDARLKAIEALLTAHFVIQLTERGGLTSSEVDNSKDQYVSYSALGNSALTGLNLSRYGQQAMLFDTSGTLKEMSKTVALKARFSVIGDACDNGLGVRRSSAYNAGWL